MKKLIAIRCAAGAAVALLGLSVGQASAGVITQWTFENQPITGAAPNSNNSPTPSTGSGTAGSIGMNIYPTPTVGVTTDDIAQGATGDTGTNTNANLTQIWRVRAQAGASGAANGWSSAAPIGTQGAQFFVSTAGYSAINVSFDWYATNAGEANMMLQYTNDGTHWINVPIVAGAADAPGSVLTNSSSANTVTGSYINGGTAGQQWFPGLTATITDPLAANNPNFGIEMVNASTGADDVAIKGGTALNNSSGNWRFDNVTISGTAVTTPEPTALGACGLAGMALLARRRRKAE
jgi:hypothetical protein